MNGPLRVAGVPVHRLREQPLADTRRGGKWLSSNARAASPLVRQHPVELMYADSDRREAIAAMACSRSATRSRGASPLADDLLVFAHGTLNAGISRSTSGEVARVAGVGRDPRDLGFDAHRLREAEFVFALGASSDHREVLAK